MTIPKKPKTQNPVLFDKLISELQDHLEAELPWLDYVFGQAQTLRASRGQGREVKYPAVHLAAGEYVNVLPDQDLGNTSFVLLRDPQRLETIQTEFMSLSTSFALIFWFNITEIFEGATDRNTEAVKKAILKSLTAPDLALKSGRLTLSKLYEKADNVFKEFDIKELDSQYFMHPYAGIRIEGALNLKDICLSS